MTVQSARVPDDRRSLDRDRRQLGIGQRRAVGDVVGEDIRARQDGQVDPALDGVLALDAVVTAAGSGTRLTVQGRARLVAYANRAIAPIVLRRSAGSFAYCGA